MDDLQIVYGPVNKFNKIDVVAQNVAFAPGSRVYINVAQLAKSAYGALPNEFNGTVNLIIQPSKPSGQPLGTDPMAIWLKFDDGTKYFYSKTRGSSNRIHFNISIDYSNLASATGAGNNNGVPASRLYPIVFFAQSFNMPNPMNADVQAQLNPPITSNSQLNQFAGASFDITFQHNVSIISSGVASPVYQPDVAVDQYCAFAFLKNLWVSSMGSTTYPGTQILASTFNAPPYSDYTSRLDPSYIHTNWTEY